MRMHPRRHGAYNFSARAASAFTNAYFRNKKRKEKYKPSETSQDQVSGEYIGLFFIIIIGIFILIIISSLN